jgi:hypothetical protein
MKRTLPLRQRASNTSTDTSRVVAILGMHRSGTSWLAGSLQHLGLELGDVNTAAQHNARGNRENDFIRELHGSVLRRNGGSWRDPRWPNKWPFLARRKLVRFIRTMNARHDAWGFKDPRTLFVIDEWQRQVPNLVRVGIYRHPLAVYRSLNKRHPDFTEDEAVGLWRAHNVRLLEEFRREPFTIIRFDVEPSVLSANLASMAAGLELDVSKDPKAFFDPDLVHNSNAIEERIPPSVIDVWDALRSAETGSVA